MMPATTDAPYKTVLVVDDDTELRSHISDYLSGHGFSVEQAADGAQMDSVLKEHRIDLVVLDVMLPQEDGLSICRRIARRDGPAILMLSAMGDEADRVLGLEFGADSYLRKPCSPRELLAHIRALLRRREELSAPAAPTSVLRSFNGFTVDMRRRQLSAANGAAVLLTAAEFALLKVFLDSPERIVSRDQLAEAVNGGETAIAETSIEVLISRLRRKLRSDHSDDLIRTYRGEGYLFDAVVTS